MATCHLPANPPIKNYSIFLLGKAGSGKSRTGNSILGNPIAFEFGTPTEECAVKMIEDKSGKKIHVIDTPSDTSSDLNLKQIQETVNLLKDHSIPIFIFCIQIGRFTEYDRFAYENYKRCLGDCINSHALIIFTCFDKWENDMKDLQIKNPDFKTYITSLSHHNKSLLHSCGRHWVAFNNRLKGENNNNQVNSLFEKIDEMLKTVCQSQQGKLKNIFFGPKDIVSLGAVPSTKKLPKVEKDHTQSKGEHKGLAKFSKNRKI